MNYILRKIKFLVKKLKISEYEYSLMEFKSKSWDEASKKVLMSREDNYAEAKNVNGVVMLNFLTDSTYTFTVNIKDLLKSLHFIDDDFECKINIK